LKELARTSKRYLLQGMVGDDKDKAIAQELGFHLEGMDNN